MTSLIDRMVDEYFKKYNVSASEVLGDIDAIGHGGALPQDIMSSMRERHGDALLPGGEDAKMTVFYMLWLSTVTSSVRGDHLARTDCSANGCPEHGTMEARDVN